LKTQVNGSISCVHELKELISLKYSSTKTIYRLNAIPMPSFTEIEKVIPKLIRTTKSPK
jgi:hypothetical protein